MDVLYMYYNVCMQYLLLLLLPFHLSDYIQFSLSSVEKKCWFKGAHSWSCYIVVRLTCEHGGLQISFSL